MSSRELDRFQVLTRVAERRSSQAEAARILGVSDRQLRRLWKSYRAGGVSALVSKRRGQPSNHRYSGTLKDAAIGLVRERYWDFGPTFAQEKLEELHGLRVSVTTLRKWMIEADVWIPRRQRERRIHQPRQRRECYGELIQIDGSDHHWFEDRAPRSVLLVYIDDATGALMELFFCDGESTFNYFEATKGYLEHHGKPVAFYSDKAAVFRVNAKNAKAGDGYTQFGRAMGELNIETMCANTPQAKGRVERMNLTLQDRLVKELRLAGISTVEEANKFGAGFMEAFNKRFQRPALNSHNAHRPLRADEALPQIFTWQEKRKVSKDLTLNYKRVMYLLDDSDVARRDMGRYVDVCETDEGEVHISHEGRELSARPFHRDAHVHQAAIVENKVLGAALEFAKKLQQERDAKKLRAKGVNQREKRQLRARQQRASGMC